MLQKIRDGASGPLAYVIVGLISVIFGVWGIGSYFTPSSDPSVADVGSVQILNSELQQSFNQRYQQLRQSLGEDFDSKQYPAGEVRKQVLKTLIDEAILKQYAHETGYRVVDDTLAQAIRGQEQFQDEDGQFSAQRYRQLLAQAGMSPADYEARLRPALLADQPRHIITQSALAVPAEVKQALRHFHEQRKVSLLSFDTSAYRDQVELSDEEIQSYYDEHKDDFMAEPRVKLAFVELNADQLDLENADKTDQSRDEARAQAFKDKAQRMEELAYQAPNDLDTLAEELDLEVQHTDWLSQDETPDSGLAQHEQVRQAAFSDAVLTDKLNSKAIKIGEQRRVVLRVQDYEKARHKPLEAVRDTIEKRLTAQKAAELAREDADKAHQQAQKGQSLQQLASRFSAARTKQVGFVGRDDQSLSRAVLDTAFAIPLGAQDSDKGHYRVTADDDDEQVVLVEVSERRIDDKAKHAKAEQHQIAEQMSTYNANLEYGALLHYLRNTAKVKVHESNLN